MNMPESIAGAFAILDPTDQGAFVGNRTNSLGDERSVDNRSSLMHAVGMAHTLTEPQKRLIQELLQVGRWNNESEIIRYGLHLVAKEVEDEQARSLEPYAAGVLARAYRRLTPRDLREEKAMERASARPQKGELE